MTTENYLWASKCLYIFYYTIYFNLSTRFNVLHLGHLTSISASPSERRNKSLLHILHRTSLMGGFSMSFLSISYFDFTVLYLLFKAAPPCNNRRFERLEHIDSWYSFGTIKPT